MRRPVEPRGPCLVSGSVTEVLGQRVFVVCLEGSIDDSFAPASLEATVSESAHDGFVVLDLERLVRVASSGIRRWALALSALNAAYSCFARCRPAVAAQFGLVGGFGGRGHLLSFYAPFFCTACDH